MRADRVVAAIAAALSMALLASGIGATQRAKAQGGYPDRPVTLIVPYAPGGVADVGMRLLGEKLSGLFHQQFVVENRPGYRGRSSRRGRRSRRLYALDDGQQHGHRRGSVQVAALSCPDRFCFGLDRGFLQYVAGDAGSDLRFGRYRTSSLRRVPTPEN